MLVWLACNASKSKALCMSVCLSVCLHSIWVHAATSPAAVHVTIEVFFVSSTALALIIWLQKDCWMKLLAAIIRHLQHVEWRSVELKLAQILSLNCMRTASKQIGICFMHGFHIISLNTTGTWSLIFGLMNSALLLQSWGTGVESSFSQIVIWCYSM